MKMKVCLFVFMLFLTNGTSLPMDQLKNAADWISAHIYEYVYDRYMELEKIINAEQSVSDYEVSADEETGATANIKLWQQTVIDALHKCGIQSDSANVMKNIIEQLINPTHSLNNQESSENKRKEDCGDNLKSLFYEGIRLNVVTHRDLIDIFQKKLADDYVEQWSKYPNTSCNDRIARTYALYESVAPVTCAIDKGAMMSFTVGLYAKKETSRIMQ